MLLLVIPIIAVIFYMGWMKLRRSLLESELHLAIRWEGLYLDKNYRDIGASINQCYGSEVMRSGLVFRSNGWFSGWNCNKIGNPETIYSLNYDPEKDDYFFCWDSQEKHAHIGKVLNTATKLSELEFLNTWNNNDMRQSACDIFKDILISIQQHKTILIHCDAGRDRTGVYSSIIAAIAAESSGILNQSMLEAIECDYRKTASLPTEKYGRMETFIKHILEKDSVSQFLASQCQIPEKEIKQTGAILAEPKWMSSLP
jgi:hypothetical protein